MTVMAKRKPKQPEAAGQTDQKPAPGAPGAGKKYPSRERVKYVGIPAAMYDELERYARDHSTEIDEKSISWAARLAIHRFLTAEGRWPPKQPPATPG